MPRKKTTRKPKKARRMATLEIHGPGKMSDAERRDLMCWLSDIYITLCLRPYDLTGGRFTTGLNYYTR